MWRLGVTEERVTVGHVDLLSVGYHRQDELGDIVIVVGTLDNVSLPVDDLEGSILQRNFDETDVKCYSVRLALRYLC